MSYCLNLRILKEFCNVYFTKLLADYRIPANICIYQRLWTGMFGANGTSLRFLCRNRFLYLGTTVRGGSKIPAKSMMEHFVIIVNGWKALTIITNSFILDVAVVLNPPLAVKLWTYWMYFIFHFFCYSWKRTTVMKSLSIYFGHYSLAFLKSFLNILNK